MIALNGRGSLRWDDEPFVARVTTDPNRPAVVRGSEVLLCRSPDDAAGLGFRCILAPGGFPSGMTSGHVLEVPPELQHLEDGDVIRCEPRSGDIGVTYKRRATANTLLLTENCNNHCVMCCQPPTTASDDYLVAVALETLRLMDRSTGEVGISGGEPTLKWDGLLRVIRTAKAYLPDTAVQVLSNGRVFKYIVKAQELATIRHPHLIVGVPVNSALPEVHDYIVQRRGAFDETILGLMNLKRCGIAVEVRVVISRANVDGLPELGRFIARNLPFADHIALMGMEVHGFALENRDWLWVDPIDYEPQLAEAVLLLAAHCLPVSIFNIPICVLSTAIRRFARRSISDWKVEYLRECRNCAARAICSGVFATSHGIQSRGIRALTEEALSTDFGSSPLRP